MHFQPSGELYHVHIPEKYNFFVNEKSPESSHYILSDSKIFLAPMIRKANFLACGKVALTSSYLFSFEFCSLTDLSRLFIMVKGVHAWSLHKNMHGPVRTAK